MNEHLLELEIKLLDELKGKISLLQEKEERERFAHEGLDKLCGRLEKDLLLEKVQTLKSKEERGEFLEQFFSYGIIDELFRKFYSSTSFKKRAGNMICIASRACAKYFSINMGFFSTL